MIVDTSALVAILRLEPGHEKLIMAISAAPEVRISAGTLVEARIVASNYGFLSDLEDYLTKARVAVVPVDEPQADLAADAFAKFGKGRHPAKLNYGDLFAYALSQTLDEPLLFKGNDFAKTDVKRAV